MIRLHTAIAALIVGVFGAIIVEPWTFLRRAEYRTEVQSLYHRLQPGMTRQEVRAEITLDKYPHLRFAEADAMWSAAAPFEFGAGNWVLLIEFDGERVSAVRVGTADDLTRHPGEAPPDKRRARGPD